MNIGVIAIGRNEGERLRRCLASLVGRGFPVVYVDSQSTDGSADLARSMGAEVVSLDLSIPFSAARARNEGFARLMRIAPEAAFVMFVDGDCEVVEGWPGRATAELTARPEAAIVCGRRRERHPEASVYNRLADLEWDTPIGEAQSCGGDSVMRASAFKEAGGFDASVAAGEEPELCQRLREKGWKILRLDAEMTIHDSAMLRFGQWWKRAVRSGYGAMDVASRFGRRGLFVQQVRSARVWTVGWAGAVLFFLLCLALAPTGSRLTRAGFLLCSAAIASLWPLQVLRTARGIRRRSGDGRTALAYGWFTMLGKWANVCGQWRYRRDRAAGRNTRLIEYKAGPAIPREPLTPAAS